MRAGGEIRPLHRMLSLNELSFEFPRYGIGALAVRPNPTTPGTAYRGGTIYPATSKPVRSAHSS